MCFGFEGTLFTVRIKLKIFTISHFNIYAKASGNSLLADVLGLLFSLRVNQNPNTFHIAYTIRPLPFMP